MRTSPMLALAVVARASDERHCAEERRSRIAADPRDSHERMRRRVMASLIRLPERERP